MNLGWVREEDDMAEGAVVGTAPVERFERFVFDLDGTVWRSGELLPHAREVLSELVRRRRSVVFMTNSPNRSCEQVAMELRHLGIETADERVVTSGRAAREYLRGRGFVGGPAFLIGEPGLRRDLEKAVSLEIVEVDDLIAAERARFVVVGRDEDLSYAKLRTAFRAIRSGALFLATNRDAVYPVRDGLWPGGGAIVAALEYATGVAATSVGKPERPMLDAVERALGPGGPVLVVGDKVEADVAGARRMGWSGALVLTGATAACDPYEIEPDFVFDDLSGLLVESR